MDFLRIFKKEHRVTRRLHRVAQRTLRVALCLLCVALCSNISLQAQPTTNIVSAEGQVVPTEQVALAFQTDTTRLCTFLMAHDGSNRSFKEDGVPDGHHSISHHQRKAENLDKLAKIDLFYSRQFAYFLDKLTSKKDADGKTLLHNSMIVWGSGLADPDRHRHTDLPIVLAGHGGGTIKTGQHSLAGEDTPMSNLFLSLLDRVGVKEERFGDSTGRLSQIG